MKNDIVLVPYEETDGMIFCGYFEGHLLLKNGNPLLSRTHKQPYRIYHANGISQAMAASETQGRYFIMETMADQNAIELPSELKGNKFRIRKLTPRECFRLMGVDDKDINKIQAAGISQSGQYKLAGNSIVVDVLFHIFRKMFIETDQDFDGTPTQLTLF
jgi:site-specific DNA-cytosine methylase